MNKENSEKLIALAPNLYRVIEKDPFNFKRIGFDVGDGWFSILEKASIKLEALITKLPEEERIIHRCVQIKEKFGNLRIYLDRGLPGASEIIEEAEILASKTCAVCGDAGSFTKISVICTLCYCAQQHEKALERSRYPSKKR